MAKSPPRAVQAFREVLVSGEDSGGNEYTGIRRDGSTFPVFIHSSRRLRDKEILGIRGILVDMPDTKRAEEERQRLRAQLFRAQKVESIGTLAGGIAHDFNNLLGGILGGVSLMELDLSNRAVLQQELQEMNELVNRGAELTKQLLGFAHRGRYVVRYLNVNESLFRNSKMFGRAHKNIIIHHDFTHAKSSVLAVEVSCLRQWATRC